MKKHLLAAVIFTAVLFAGCADSDLVSDTDTALSENEETGNTEFLAETLNSIRSDVFCRVGDVSVDDIIAKSNCLIRAKFVSCEDCGDHYNYTFSPVETIKNITDKTIEDEIVLKEYSGKQDFTEGEYILPLMYVNSVYFDAPVFTLSYYAVIPCGSDVIRSISVDGLSLQSSENLIKISDFVEYANSIEDCSESLSGDYITSTSLNDIVRQSDYIVKAVIENEPLRSGENRGIYTCNLTQGYKGEIDETFEAVFMYDSVEVGKEYYFFLTKTDPTAAFYIVSSKNSIYGSEDSNVVSALENCGII